MKTKKFFVLILAVLMTLTSFEGCIDRTENNSKSYDSSKIELETSPLDTEDTEDDVPLTKVSHGIINGNTYTNDFADITITTIDSCRFLDSDDLRQLRGISASDWQQIDLEELLKRYELLCIAGVDTTSSYDWRGRIRITLDDLESSGRTSLTDEEYLKEILDSTEVNRVYPGMLGSNLYSITDVMLEGRIDSKVYIRRIGKYMIVIVLAANDQKSFETLESMFS